MSDEFTELDRMTVATVHQDGVYSYGYLTVACELSLRRFDQRADADDAWHHRHNDV